MSAEYKQVLTKRFGYFGICLADAMFALDSIAELGRMLVASDNADLDDEGRGGLDPAAQLGMHHAVELLARGISEPLRAAIEAELSRPAPAPWAGWQQDRDSRLSRELAVELERAHKIIGNALGLMTDRQKNAWAQLNSRDDADGEGITRAMAREALIERAREAVGGAA